MKNIKYYGNFEKNVKIFKTKFNAKKVFKSKVKNHLLNTGCVGISAICLFMFYLFITSYIRFDTTNVILQMRHVAQNFISNSLVRELGAAYILTLPFRSLFEVKHERKKHQARKKMAERELQKLSEALCKENVHVSVEQLRQASKLDKKYTHHYEKTSKMKSTLGNHEIENRIFEQDTYYGDILKEKSVYVLESDTEDFIHAEETTVADYFAMIDEDGRMQVLTQMNEKCIYNGCITEETISYMVRDERELPIHEKIDVNKVKVLKRNSPNKKGL